MPVQDIEKRREYGREWGRRYRLKHPDRAKKSQQIYRRFVKRGLTEKDFHRLIDVQAGLCAICHEMMDVTDIKVLKGTPGRTCCIDHDHRTGKVRGLLCAVCNRGLGFFKDSGILLSSAFRYLENSNG